MRTIEPTEQVVMASTAIAQAVGELLNGKHLYQSVAVEVKVEGLVEVRRGRGRKELIQAAESVLDGCDWIVAMGDGVFPIEPGNLLPFQIPVVRASCRACEEKTPFHLDGEDRSRRSTVSLAPQRQVFCIPMRCQGCRQTPLVFMFTRGQRKLTLTGREPIEVVRAPNFIPREQARFYSDAILANGSGKPLAGLFFLRTLIEQYMRSGVGDKPVRGEDLARAYSGTLEPELASRLPSFGEAYERLSEALHAAREDQKLFDELLTAIEHHFEAKAAFAKIPKRKQAQ